MQQVVTNRDEFFIAFLNKVYSRLIYYIEQVPSLFNIIQIQSTAEELMEICKKSNRLPLKADVFAAITIIRYRNKYRLMITRDTILNTLNVSEGGISYWVKLLNLKYLP